MAMRFAAFRAANGAAIRRMTPAGTGALPCRRPRFPRKASPFDVRHPSDGTCLARRRASRRGGRDRDARRPLRGRRRRRRSCPSSTSSSASSACRTRCGCRSASGTSLAVIIPTSIRSFNAHRARGAVDMSILKAWALPVVFGVAIGSFVARYRAGRSLQDGFRPVAGISAVRLLFGRESWRLGTEMPSGPVMTIYGWLIGVLSALMGIGGGQLSNLFMTFYGRPIHQAVATSSGLGVLISIPGAIGYVSRRLAEGGAISRRRRLAAAPGAGICIHRRPDRLRPDEHRDGADRREPRPPPLQAPPRGRLRRLPADRLCPLPCRDRPVGAYQTPVFGIDAQGSAGAFASPALQKLDRDAVRRAHEGHVAVPRRPVDGDAGIHQPLAGLVDVVDPVGEVAEVAPALIGVLVPVVGQLDERAPSSRGPFRRRRARRGRRGCSAPFRSRSGALPAARACCSRSRGICRGRPPGPWCVGIPSGSLPLRCVPHGRSTAAVKGDWQISCVGARRAARTPRAMAAGMR